MKNLTPEQIYWFTLIGIAGCFFVMGYALGMLRGGKLGYDDGYEDGYQDARTEVDELLEPEKQPKIGHFDTLKAPPTWVIDTPEAHS